MLLSTGNITLRENKGEASEMTKNVFIRLFSFLMKVTVYVPCSFNLWRMTPNVLNVDVSEPVIFFRAAEESFTQSTIEEGLSENCSFDFKFNVPVGFDGIEIS